MFLQNLVHVFAYKKGVNDRNCPVVSVYMSIKLTVMCVQELRTGQKLKKNMTKNHGSNRLS